jgi:curved DNA-binding protein CbpA
MSALDPYKTLQVDPEAEDEVIEAAYKRLARKYHPDVSPSREAQDRMVLLNQAWEQLRDPTRRAAVDRARTRAAGNGARVAAADAHARTAGQPPATAPSNVVGGPQQRRAHTGGPPSAAGAGPQTGSAFGGISESQPAGRFAPAPTTWAASQAMAGGHYETRSVRPQATGPAAAQAPGNPSGSVINFGRFAGWSLGEIARVEPEYLEWLDRVPIGRMYQAEIDLLLRARGLRAAVAEAPRSRGLFRRR